MKKTLKYFFILIFAITLAYYYVFESIHTDLSQKKYLLFNALRNKNEYLKYHCYYNKTNDMCKSIKSSLNLNKSINVRIPSGFSNYLHYHENLDNIINKYEGYKILPDNKDFVSTIYFIENNVSISCLMYNQALKTKNKFPIVFQNMKKCDLNILLDLTI